MEWSQEKCVLLIEAYRNYKCLWDPNSEDFKNATRKQDAWEEIAHILKCNVEVAMKKMDSLLASYRRERQKTMTRKLGSGANCTYNSKWFAFKSMHFLMDKYKPRKTIDFDTNQNKNMADEQENEVKNEHEEVTVVDPNGSSQSGSQTYTEPVDSVQSTLTTRKKIKLEDPRVEEAHCIIKDTHESNGDKSQAFGNYVASKHSGYSKRTRAYVEHCINNILFEADLGKFDLEPNAASTPMSPYSESSQNRFE